MSKNIIIQEGGIAKQLTADKLKTNLVGGAVHACGCRKMIHNNVVIIYK